MISLRGEIYRDALFPFSREIFISPHKKVEEEGIFRRKRGRLFDLQPRQTVDSLASLFLRLASTRVRARVAIRSRQGVRVSVAGEQTSTEGRWFPLYFALSLNSGAGHPFLCSSSGRCVETNDSGRARSRGRKGGEKNMAQVLRRTNFSVRFFSSFLFSLLSSFLFVARHSGIVDRVEYRSPQMRFVEAENRRDDAPVRPRLSSSTFSARKRFCSMKVNRTGARKREGVSRRVCEERNTYKRGGESWSNRLV